MGIVNIYEIVMYLCGEVGEWQVEGVKVGMVYVIGFGLVCGIYIFEKVLQVGGGVQFFCLRVVCVIGRVGICVCGVGRECWVFEFVRCDRYGG